ncbi:MAG: ParB/RepB/Spo0J family partition protein [Desulfatirhabdiaceae bacterium]
MQKEHTIKEALSSSKKKSGLGRGLSALIPDIDMDDVSPSDFFMCDIFRIRPNRYQPRIRFRPEELEELCASIKEQGIIQPILVRKDDAGFELIAGERRLRAAKLAGLTSVPVVVKDVPDAKLLELSIIENIQRENLNPIEESEAYYRLMTDFQLTQEQVADRVGKSRPAVTNFLRLRQLPEPIRTSVLDNQLSMGHARALLGAQTPAQQTAAWREVVRKGLSVRETEALIQRLKQERQQNPKKLPDSTSIHLEHLASELSQGFGTKVTIVQRGSRGKVEIEYYSPDDLNRLIELLRRQGSSSNEAGGPDID